MAKRKASAKQKAAARRNIKKAQAALRAKRKGHGKAHTKRVRKAAHTAAVSPKGRRAKRRAAVKRTARKARRTSARRHKRATPKQLRALSKARAARRRNLRKPGHRRHRVRAHQYISPRKRIRVPSHLSREETPRRRRKKRSGQTAAQRRASKRNIKKAQAARRRGTHRRHRARETHALAAYNGYAMENPLSGTEIFVGGLTGLLGFGVADVLDRFLATHALTSLGTTSTAGWTQYSDTPPTAATFRNPYKNMFNAAAVIAPMGIMRWGVGLTLTAVPIVAARWVKAPVGRSALQFFGFGVGFRVIGKGLQDLFAYVFKKTSFGLRLYDGEVRAWAMKSGQLQFVPGTNDESGALQGSLPAAGLGNIPLVGCGSCANCITGVGACANGSPAGRNSGMRNYDPGCQPGSPMWGDPGPWPPCPPGATTIPPQGQPFGPTPGGSPPPPPSGGFQPPPSGGGLSPPPPPPPPPFSPPPFSGGPTPVGPPVTWGRGTAPTTPPSGALPPGIFNRPPGGGGGGGTFQPPSGFSPPPGSPLQIITPTKPQGTQGVPDGFGNVSPTRKNTPGRWGHDEWT